MARDIRDLFKDEAFKQEPMPENHEERFLKKLNTAFPETNTAQYNWYKVAASVVVLLGLSFGAYNYFNSNELSPETLTKTVPEKIKTLGDISPGLKKVEDYYLASINLELSKVSYTPETKDLFEGYLKQLEDLNNEYERLSLELTQNGPNELTVNALIDNLKYRLNLLYRLRAQLESLDADENTLQSI